MKFWRWLKSLPASVFFGIVAGVVFVVGAVLSKKQKRPSVAPMDARVNHGIGVADHAAEMRAALKEDITTVDAEIARVTVASEGKTAAEVAADFNARRRK